jgi:hypothetical protein
MHFEPFPEYDIALSLEMNPRIVVTSRSICRSRSDRVYAQCTAEA